MITTIGTVMETSGGVVIHTNRPGADRLSDVVTVIWHDKERISAEQRRKAYALMGEIAAWSGMTAEQVKATEKARYWKQYAKELNDDLFSLSDCSMTVARGYINHLIDLILEFEIPTRQPLYENSDDIDHYVYACLKHKKCAVCGRHAELHHVDAIGMGYDRREKPQIGNAVISLCREHHTMIHQKGNAAFLSVLHLSPVALDDQCARVYNLTKSARRNPHE